MGASIGAKRAGETTCPEITSLTSDRQADEDKQIISQYHSYELQDASKYLAVSQFFGNKRIHGFQQKRGQTDARKRDNSPILESRNTNNLAVSECLK